MSAGPIAKTVYDAAAVLDAVSGISKRDRLTFDARSTQRVHEQALDLGPASTKIGYWDPAFNLSNVANNPPTRPSSPSRWRSTRRPSARSPAGATIDRSRYLDDNGYDEFSARSAASRRPASSTSTSTSRPSGRRQLQQHCRVQRADPREVQQQPARRFIRPEPSANNPTTDPFTRDNVIAYLTKRNEFRKLFEQILATPVDALGLPGAHAADREPQRHEPQHRHRERRGERAGIPA
jgi:Asp-tRNA(Asn)/Glu-tRNA(Gln) amidotransferase A subunit family amidase